jgi:hypothetical protein
MLGEQVGELNGKRTGQRILDVEKLVTENSVSATGTVGGTQVHVLLTFMGKIISIGVFHGQENGIVMSNGNTASYTGEAIGKIDSTGQYFGRIRYSTNRQELPNWLH